MANTKDTHQDSLKVASWRELVVLYLRAIKEQRTPFLFGAFCLLLLNFYQLVPPFIIGRTADELTFAQPLANKLHAVFSWSLLFAVSFALASFVRIRLKAFLSSLRNRAGLRLRSKAFHNFIANKLRGEGEQSGVLVQRLSAGIDAFYDLTYLLTNEIFRAFAITGSLVVILAWTEASQLPILLTYLFLYWVLVRYFNSRLIKLEASRAHANEQSGGVLADTLSGSQTVFTSGATKSFGRLVSSRAQFLFELEQKLLQTGLSQWLWFQILNGIFLGGLLWGVGNLVANNEMTIGAALALLGYSQTLVNSTSDLLDVWQRLQHDRAAFSRIAALIHLDAVEKVGSPILPLDSWKTIAVRDLVFGYGSGSAVFDGANCDLHRGERIAIVGPSGSGKTTLGKLLVGALKPMAGEISLDGVPYQGDHELVNDTMSIALQDCEVFSLSLGENITLLREVTPELFEAAVRVSRLGSVIERLPDGLDTLLGEKGQQLSGGEMQRLSIARALVKNPSLLVLDESTAMLEEGLESKVFNEIFSLLPNSTIVLISHHERSLEFFPRRLELRGKQIVVS